MTCTRRPVASHRRRLDGRAAALAAVLAMGTLAGCAEEPVYLPDTGRPRPTSPRVLGLPKNPVVLLGLGRGNRPLTQLGSADVELDVVSMDGGEVEVVDGRDGRPALRFPRFSARASAYPRAVVAVRNAGDEDQLNPGARPFTWGADFRIDPRSAGASVDNGDNLVQRGLSSQPALYKAEIDGDRPACEVRGDEGTLIVRAPERIRPGWWTHIQCRRTGTELAVFVTQYHPDGEVESYASRANGPMGRVVMAEPSIPLTVGGKVGLDGALIGKATDQFNGSVMQPFYAVTGPPEAAR